MSRRRKPQPKSIAGATDAVVWRSRILCEMLEGREGDNPLQAAIRNLEHALEDYEASRNVSAEPVAIYDRPPLLDFGKAKQ